MFRLRRRRFSEYDEQQDLDSSDPKVRHTATIAEEDDEEDKETLRQRSVPAIIDTEDIEVCTLHESAFKN